MRLNFAGVPEAEIREGIRRIGKAIREQLGLLGSLTGGGVPAGTRTRAEGAGMSGERDAAAPEPNTQDASPTREPQPDAADGDAHLADVVALPRRDEAPSARRRRDR
jgi:hypothetical protein